jgi:hypothetical protein
MIPMMIITTKNLMKHLSLFTKVKKYKKIIKHKKINQNNKIKIKTYSQIEF